MRRAAGVGAWLLVCAAAAGQDMPLSQVLIEGEGWRPAAKEAGERLQLGKGGTVPSGDGYYDVNQEGEIVLQTCLRVKLASPPPGGRFIALAVTPDRGTLVATASGGRHVYAFRIGEHRALDARVRYYPLRVRRGQKAVEAAGLTFDTRRRLYVATATGVQVFDPTGRLCGELLPPERGKGVKDVAFGGKARDHLYVLSESGKVFSRKVRSQGVAPEKEK